MGMLRRKTPSFGSQAMQTRGFALRLPAQAYADRQQTHITSETRLPRAASHQQLHRQEQPRQTHALPSPVVTVAVASFLTAKEVSQLTTSIVAPFFSALRAYCPVTVAAAGVGIDQAQMTDDFRFHTVSHIPFPEQTAEALKQRIVDLFSQELDTFLNFVREERERGAASSFPTHLFGSVAVELLRNPVWLNHDTLRAARMLTAQSAGPSQKLFVFDVSEAYRLHGLNYEHDVRPLVGGGWELPRTCFDLTEIAPPPVLVPLAPTTPGDSLLPSVRRVRSATNNDWLQSLSQDTPNVRHRAKKKSISSAIKRGELLPALQAALGVDAKLDPTRLSRGGCQFINASQTASPQAASDPLFAHKQHVPLLIGGSGAGGTLVVDVKFHPGTLRKNTLLALYAVRREVRAALVETYAPSLALLPAADRQLNPSAIAEAAWWGVVRSASSMVGDSAAANAVFNDYYRARALSFATRECKRLDAFNPFNLSSGIIGTLFADSAQFADACIMFQAVAMHDEKANFRERERRQADWERLHRQRNDADLQWIVERVMLGDELETEGVDAVSARAKRRSSKKTRLANKRHAKTHVATVECASKALAKTHEWLPSCPITRALLFIGCRMTVEERCLWRNVVSLLKEEVRRATAHASSAAAFRGGRLLQGLGVAPDGGIPFTSTMIESDIRFEFPSAAPVYLPPFYARKVSQKKAVSPPPSDSPHSFTTNANSSATLDGAAAPAESTASLSQTPTEDTFFVTLKQTIIRGILPATNVQLVPARHFCESPSQAKIESFETSRLLSAFQQQRETDIEMSEKVAAAGGVHFSRGGATLLGLAGAGARDPTLKGDGGEASASPKLSRSREWATYDTASPSFNVSVALQPEALLQSVSCLLQHQSCSPANEVEERMCMPHPSSLPPSVAQMYAINGDSVPSMANITPFISTAALGGHGALNSAHLSLGTPRPHRLDGSYFYGGTRVAMVERHLRSRPAMQRSENVVMEQQQQQEVNPRRQGLARPQVARSIPVPLEQQLSANLSGTVADKSAQRNTLDEMTATGPSALCDHGYSQLWLTVDEAFRNYGAVLRSPNEEPIYVPTYLQTLATDVAAEGGCDDATPSGVATSARCIAYFHASQFVACPPRSEATLSAGDDSVSGNDRQTTGMAVAVNSLSRGLLGVDATTQTHVDSDGRHVTSCTSLSRPLFEPFPPVPSGITTHGMPTMRDIVERDCMLHFAQLAVAGLAQTPLLAEVSEPHDADERSDIDLESGGGPNFGHESDSSSSHSFAKDRETPFKRRMHVDAISSVDLEGGASEPAAAAACLKAEAEQQIHVLRFLSGGANAIRTVCSQTRKDGVGDREEIAAGEAAKTQSSSTSLAAAAASAMASLGSVRAPVNYDIFQPQLNLTNANDFLSLELISLARHHRFRSPHFFTVDALSSSAGDAIRLAPHAPPFLTVGAIASSFERSTAANTATSMLSTAATSLNVKNEKGCGEASPKPRAPFSLYNASNEVSQKSQHVRMMAWLTGYKLASQRWGLSLFARANRTFAEPASQGAAAGCGDSLVNNALKCLLVSKKSQVVTLSSSSGKPDGSVKENAEERVQQQQQHRQPCEGEEDTPLDKEVVESTDKALQVNSLQPSLFFEIAKSKTMEKVEKLKKRRASPAVQQEAPAAPTRYSSRPFLTPIRPRSNIIPFGASRLIYMDRNGIGTPLSNYYSHFLLSTADESRSRSQRQVDFFRQTFRIDARVHSSGPISQVNSLNLPDSKDVEIRKRFFGKAVVNCDQLDFESIESLLFPSLEQCRSALLKASPHISPAVIHKHASASRDLLEVRFCQLFTMDVALLWPRPRSLGQLVGFKGAVRSHYFATEEERMLMDNLKESIALFSSSNAFEPTQLGTGSVSDAFAAPSSSATKRAAKGKAENTAADVLDSETLAAFARLRADGNVSSISLPLSLQTNSIQDNTTAVDLSYLFEENADCLVKLDEEFAKRQMELEIRPVGPLIFQLAAKEITFMSGRSNRLRKKYEQLSAAVARGMLFIPALFATIAGVEVRPNQKSLGVEADLRQLLPRERVSITSSLVGTAANSTERSAAASFAMNADGLNFGAEGEYRSLAHEEGGKSSGGAVATSFDRKQREVFYSLRQFVNEELILHWTLYDPIVVEAKSRRLKGQRRRDSRSLTNAGCGVSGKEDRTAGNMLRGATELPTLYTSPQQPSVFTSPSFSMPLLYLDFETPQSDDVVAILSAVAVRRRYVRTEEVAATTSNATAQLKTVSTLLPNSVPIYSCFEDVPLWISLASIHEFSDALFAVESALLHVSSPFSKGAALAALRRFFNESLEANHELLGTARSLLERKTDVTETRIHPLFALRKLQRNEKEVLMRLQNARERAEGESIAADVVSANSPPASASKEKKRTRAKTTAPAPAPPFSPFAEDGVPSLTHVLGVDVLAFNTILPIGLLGGRTDVDVSKLPYTDRKCNCYFHISDFAHAHKVLSFLLAVKQSLHSKS